MKNLSPSHILKASTDELIAIIKSHDDYSVEQVILSYGILKMKDTQALDSFPKEAEILKEKYKVKSLDDELGYWMHEYWSVPTVKDLKAKIEKGGLIYKEENRLRKQFKLLKILGGVVGLIWGVFALVELGAHGLTGHHILGMMILVLIYAVILVAKYLGLILKELKKRALI